MVAVLLGLGVGFGDLTQSSPWTSGTANAANDDNYELVYKKPIVETVSSDADVALARHLSKVGCKAPRVAGGMIGTWGTTLRLVCVAQSKQQRSYATANSSCERNMRKRVSQVGVAAIQSLGVSAAAH